LLASTNRPPSGATDRRSYRRPYRKCRSWASATPVENQPEASMDERSCSVAMTPHPCVGPEADARTGVSGPPNCMRDAERNRGRRSADHAKNSAVEGEREKRDDQSHAGHCNNDLDHSESIGRQILTRGEWPEPGKLRARQRLSYPRLPPPPERAGMTGRMDRG